MFLVIIMEKQILHVDVNNAFLSWTALDRLNNGYDLDIRTIASAIGGDEERRSGIILAKSPKAKACGVVTGEPIYQAKRKCPNLQIFAGNYKLYRECSNKLYNLLLEYTDKIERFSIDECFLDMTEFLVKRNLIDVANEINRRVREELKFTVNVGVANNKLLAKMASDFTKPDKVHTLYKYEIQNKMWNLPVGELFMLGKKTVPKLNDRGIRTIGDLARADKIMLSKMLGKHGVLMWEYANGIDNSEVNYLPSKPKGIGNSVTLPRNFNTKEEICSIILALVEQVAYRLRREEMVASTVNVQLRTKDFVDFSHQGKLPSSTSSTKDIYERAKLLLDEMYKEGIEIRLVGVRVDNLSDKDKGQISLFENTKQNEKQEKLDKTLDLLKNKFGYDSVTLAGKLNINEMVKNKKDKYE
ncbi:MAG: DNA polymerase IV [Clostridiales bacterium]|nr:DNA polymerase IV [Clostridiales bacterium]